MTTLDARLARLETQHAARSEAAQFCQCNSDSAYARITVNRFDAEDGGRADDPEICERCGKPIDAIVIHIPGAEYAES